MSHIKYVIVGDPLTLDQVIRDDKLREEIEAFRAQRRQDRLNRIQAARHAEQADAPAGEADMDAAEAPGDAAKDDSHMQE